MEIIGWWRNGLVGCTVIVLTVLLCGWKNDAKADVFQTPPQSLDTIPLIANDSINKDTLKVNNGALDAPVIYSARDSFLFDIENKKVYLYGDASVEYKDITLKAAIIVFDWNTNAVKARAMYSDSGVVGKPVFEQGDETYSADSLAYNFQTRKGRISELLTKEDEGYLHSEVVKKAGGDSYFGLNNKYTTCNYADPDYYIFTKKVKVIPKKVIVTGPANLVIADVPTPLFSPLGIFSIKQERSSGLIFPQYGERENWGFYLGDGGYYFAISDNVDLAATGTISSRGTWGTTLGSRYAKRYKYAGNTVIKYLQERILESETGEIARNHLFNVNATYNRDAKANPNYRFNTTIRFESGKFSSKYAYDPSRRLNNQFGSSISYTRIFRNKPFNFNISANHNQNTQTGAVSIGLPEATFGITQIYPFKRKVVIGNERWYEKINASYTLQAKNHITGIDTLLFNSDDLDVIRNNLSQASSYGAYHTIPVSSSLKLFKHIIVTPNASFRQWFYGRTIKRYWYDDIQLQEKDTVYGFASAYEYNAGVSTSTRLYGMYQFKRGKVKAIRHVVNPSLSFNYRPDFGQDKYGFYYGEQSDATGTVTRYSRFGDPINLFGGPAQGRQGAIGFNLGNNLEMKVASRKDTVSGLKKIKLLDRFDFGASYNIAADSLRWSVIRMNGNTTLFDKISINFRANWDPYVVDPVSLHRINKFELTENDRIARLTDATLSVGGDFSFGKKSTRTSSKGTPDEWEMLVRYPDYFVDFNVPLNINTQYVLNIDRNIIESGDTTIFNQSISLRVDLNLTQNWKFNVTTNYDIKDKKFSSTYIDVVRDLHCWQMSFRWVPIGPFQSYSFDLRVKSALLQDLKISRRKGWTDLGY